MSLNYSFEKLNSAMGIMVGPGTVQERLREAFCYNLIHIKSNDLPAPIRDDFEQLCKLFDRFSHLDPKKGSAQASADLLTDYEATEAAQMLLKIYDIVQETYFKKNRGD